MEEEQQEPSPPTAPDIRRRVHFRREQWIGIPMLLLVPVAAALGAFGESREQVHVEASGLSIDVEYPSKYRFKMLNSIRLDVTNTTPAMLDTVTVDIDTAYVARFSTVVGIPAFERPYTIELVDLPPGESRRVRVELQGEQYGRHVGELRVSAPGTDTARVSLSTFIFP